MSNNHFNQHSDDGSDFVTHILDCVISNHKIFDYRRNFQLNTTSFSVTNTKVHMICIGLFLKIIYYQGGGGVVGLSCIKSLLKFCLQISTLYMKEIIHKAPKAEIMMHLEKVHAHNRECKIL
jgi:hypothetical protein